MDDSREYEITFVTSDPALVEALLGTDMPNMATEAQVLPGVTARPRDIHQSAGIAGSEIAATIVFEIIQGVAIKVLTDLIVKLAQKYGARLKIKGKPVSADQEAITSELANGGA